MLAVKSNEYAIVYHWWQNECCDPYRNLSIPLIPSIATVRAHTKAPIYVIDVGGQDYDWGTFPQDLSFAVVSRPPLMDTGRSSKLCSRVWDVWAFVQTIPQNKILFNDCDVFWIKPPFPLDKEKEGMIDSFYCRSNTGVWYFDKRSEAAKKTIVIWKSIISLALIDDQFFHELYSIRNLFQDEVAFGYLIDNYPNLYNPILYNENCPVDYVRVKKNDLSYVRAIHALAATLGRERGLIAILCKDIANLIQKTLTETQIGLLFGKSKPMYSLLEIQNMSMEELKNFLLTQFSFCPEFPE